MDSQAAELVSAVADVLAERRNARGLSHEKLAELAGIHRSTVSRIESKSINGTLIVFVAIANALETDLARVLKQAAARVLKK